MTTGWGNEQAKDSLRRSMYNGSSGRVGILMVLLGFLAAGVALSSTVMIVIFATAAAIAAFALLLALVRAWRVWQFERRIARRL